MPDGVGARAGAVEVDRVVALEGLLDGGGDYEQVGLRGVGGPLQFLDRVLVRRSALNRL